MSNNHWTEEQLKAINSVGNVIVSAGAGSGKTAVLTQRIIHNIENQVITNLNQILILTFTNNAAAEMRERIKSKLNDSSNHRLKDLVPLIDSANICTFDAYALMLVKKYSHVLKLSPDIKIASDDIIQTKKYEILEQILDNLYKTKDQRLIKLTTNYCNHIDDLSKWIFEIADIIANENNSQEYIKKYYQNHLSEQGINKFVDDEILPLIDFIRQEVKNSIIAYNLQLIEKKKSRNKPVYINDEIFQFKDFYELFDKWNGIEWKDFFITENSNPNQDKDICNLISKLKYFNSLGLKKDIEQNRELIPFLLELAFELNNKIKYFKQSKGVYTFSDIASIATKLLIENDDIRNSIKNNLKIIMIDEYQDTSILQENFINLIANNNVFVVGDVKQSIYGFRDANPQQFIDKCNLYKSNPKKGTFINMSNNFRSKRQVIDDINRIFSEIMTKEKGGVDYCTEGKINYPTNSPYSNDRSELKQNYGVSKIDVLISKKQKTYQDTIKIIKIIAQDIINKVNNKEQIYDRNLKANRNCTFKDFAILISKKNNFKLFEKTFIEFGIPINADYQQLVREDDSTVILINLLSMIDVLMSKQINQLTKQEKTKLKHWFVSISRSFIGNYDDKTIYELVNNNDNWIQDQLFVKINKFAIDHTLSCISDIYLDLINEFDFIEKLSLIKEENVLNKLNINNIFYKKIIEMDELGYTLKNFINFLDHLDDLDIEIESPKISTSENAVILTTIHKSKGLEYGIVYLPFAKDEMREDSKSSFFSDEKYGFWLPSLHAINSKKKKINNGSLHRNLYKYYVTQTEEKPAEIMRLLYVALTRAREQLIVINEIVEEQNEETTNNNAKNEYSEKTIGDFIDNSGFFGNVEDKIIEPNDSIKLNISNNENIDDNKQIVIKEFNYVFNKLKKVRKASSYVSSEVDKNILKAGTHYHLLMQCINFKNKDTSMISNPNERKIVDTVLNNAIFNEINKGKVYQEYSFYDDIEKTVGIIDLLIEYDDHIDIIDYKLNNISDADNKYQEQLKIYADYATKSFNKLVNTYLLSIVKNQIKKVS